MEAFEFQTHVKDGMIQIPAEYRNRLHGVVRVTIIAPEAKIQRGIIANLLEDPIQDPLFSPISRDEIYAERE